MSICHPIQKLERDRTEIQCDVCRTVVGLCLLVSMVCLWIGGSQKWTQHKGAVLRISPRHKGSLDRNNLQQSRSVRSGSTRNDYKRNVKMSKLLKRVFDRERKITSLSTRGFERTQGKYIRLYSIRWVVRVHVKHFQQQSENRAMQIDRLKKWLFGFQKTSQWRLRKAGRMVPGPEHDERCRQFNFIRLILAFPSAWLVQRDI